MGDIISGGCPDLQQTAWQNNLSATPSLSTWGTRLTADATIHTKGAWGTLLTTTFDTHGFWLGINGTASGGAQTDMLLDIALGATQETIIVPDYLCGWRALPTGIINPWQYFPIFIPSGTLVSGRIQALITADTADIVVVANGGASTVPGQLFAGCDAYGINAVASQGTSHTPGTSGLESTAANIGSTMSKPYGAVAFGLGGTLADTTMQGIAYHWELVIGGVSICEWYATTSTAETQTGPFPSAPFLVSIPSGAQLQIKAESSGNTEAQDVAFYCFYK